MSRQASGLSFENIAAPDYERPTSNRPWYPQFRPGAEDSGEVTVFQGADAAHALRGLRLRKVTVAGVPLRDAATAARVANLTVGPFVEEVAFE